MGIVYVGISGLAGSGKDTLAAHIMRVMGGSPHVETHRLALGDALKQEASETLGIDIINFYNRDVKEHYRPLLQWWGTEYRRNVAVGGDNNYWVTKLKDIAQKKWGNSGKHIVVLVPDIRFDNEAKLCLDSGGMVIQIEPINQPNVEVNKHVSENGIDPSFITLTFENDHTKPLDFSQWLRITDKVYPNVFYGIQPE